MGKPYGYYNAENTDGIFSEGELEQYLRRRYGEPLTLDRMAADFGYEPCYFSKLFKRVMGTTFLQCRNRMRVEQAMRLLQGTSWSVTDIGGRCGFETVRTFNRVFRGVTGQSPRDYRMQRDSREWEETLAG